MHVEYSSMSTDKELSVILLYVATLEMRTTFFLMHLLNDNFEMFATSFILNGKEWGEGKIEIDR